MIFFLRASKSIDIVNRNSIPLLANYNVIVASCNHVFVYHFRFLEDIEDFCQHCHEHACKFVRKRISWLFIMPATNKKAKTILP